MQPAFKMLTLHATKPPRSLRPSRIPRPTTPQPKRRGSAACTRAGECALITLAHCVRKWTPSLHSEIACVCVHSPTLMIRTVLSLLAGLRGRGHAGARAPTRHSAGGVCGLEVRVWSLRSSTVRSCASWCAGEFLNRFALASGKCEWMTIRRIQSTAHSSLSSTRNLRRMASSVFS